MAGRRDEARKIRDELEKEEASPFSALGRVVLYTALGENDGAFRWLDYEPHHAWVPWLAVDPVLVPPRDDPRFQDFLRRLNLPS
ncbi:MAG: hypothetical protein ACE5JR_04040 [Gemmatimonadota bacterium]